MCTHKALKSKNVFSCCVFICITFRLHTNLACIHDDLKNKECSYMLHPVHAFYLRQLLLSLNVCVCAYEGLKRKKS